MYASIYMYITPVKYHVHTPCSALYILLYTLCTNNIFVCVHLLYTYMHMHDAVNTLNVLSSSLSVLFSLSFFPSYSSFVSLVFLHVCSAAVPLSRPNPLVIDPLFLCVNRSIQTSFFS